MTSFQCPRLASTSIFQRILYVYTTISRSLWLFYNIAAGFLLWTYACHDQDSITMIESFGNFYLRSYIAY